MNTNFADCPKGVQSLILDYAAYNSLQNRSTTRGVCKDWRDMTDKISPGKELDEDMKKYNSLRKKIKESENSILEKTTELKKFGWKAHVFVFLDKWCSCCILNAIKQIVLKIFSSMNEITPINKEINELKQGTKKLKEEITSIEDNLKSFKKITDLFGGSEKYYDLPVLELDDEEKYRDIYNHPEYMTASIMRRKNRGGARLIYLRLQSKQEDQKHSVVCLYEQFSEGGWISNYNIINDSKSLMRPSNLPEDGICFLSAGQCKGDFYDRLKDTIAKGENEVEKLV